MSVDENDGNEWPDESKVMPYCKSGLTNEII
jgi:hypothetical protein